MDKVKNASVKTEKENKDKEGDKKGDDKKDNVKESHEIFIICEPQ